MNTKQCQNMGCTQLTSYLVVRNEDQKITGGLCREHGEKMKDKMGELHHLQEIPDPASDPPVRGSSPPAPQPPQPEPPLRVQPKPIETVSVPPENDPLPVRWDEQGQAVEWDDTTEGAAMAISTEECSTNFFWKVTVGDETFTFQSTFRGDSNPDTNLSHIHGILATLERMVQAGIKPRESQSTAVAMTPPTATVGDVPPSLPAPNGAPPASAPPMAPPTAPPTATTPGQGGTFLATKMEIWPEEGDKATVKFFAPGEKRHLAQMTKYNIPSVIKKLEKTAPWSDKDFRKKGVYSIRYLVTWKPSDSINNSTGEPWKNITAVNPE